MTRLVNTLTRCGCFFERCVACVTTLLFFVMTVAFVWQEYYGLSSLVRPDSFTGGMLYIHPGGLVLLGLLGLVICREILQTHQGRVWAENHPQGGALLQFTVPANPDLTQHEDHPTINSEQEHDALVALQDMAR